MWPREDTDARYITSSEADNQRRCSRVGTLSGVSLFVQTSSVNGVRPDARNHSRAGLFSTEPVRLASDAAAMSCCS
jgi:hypothetical protein